MTHPGHHALAPGVTGTSPRAPEVASLFAGLTTGTLTRVPPQRLATGSTADSGHMRYPLGSGPADSGLAHKLRIDLGLPVPMQRPAASPRSSQRTREDGVEQATLTRRGIDEPRLSEEELRLLAQIASGVTADVAARKLELSARTLRRRLRTICDRLEVNTPIEAVVWAARRQLI